MTSGARQSGSRSRLAGGGGSLFSRAKQLWGKLDLDPQWVLAAEVVECLLLVEERAEVAAGRDTGVVAPLAGAEAVELAGGAPGQLAGVVGGGGTVQVVDVGAPPVAYGCEQPAELFVHGRVGAEPKGRPVAAWFELETLRSTAGDPDRVREAL